MGALACWSPGPGRFWGDLRGGSKILGGAGQLEELASIPAELGRVLAHWFSTEALLAELTCPELARCSDESGCMQKEPLALCIS